MTAAQRAAASIVKAKPIYDSTSETFWIGDNSASTGGKFVGPQLEVITETISTPASQSFFGLFYVPTGWSFTPTNIDIAAFGSTTLAGVVFSKNTTTAALGTNILVASSVTVATGTGSHLTGSDLQNLPLVAGDWLLIRVPSSATVTHLSMSIIFRARPA